MHGRWLDYVVMRPSVVSASQKHQVCTALLLRAKIEQRMKIERVHLSSALKRHKLRKLINVSNEFQWNNFPDDRLRITSSTNT